MSSPKPTPASDKTSRWIEDIFILLCIASLWPAILGKADWSDRILFGLNSFADCYYLVTASGWHYIRHRYERYEQLYRWRDDPLETRDQMVIERDATEQCRQYMDWFLNDRGKGRGYTNPYHYREADSEE